jgi:hypothetical protein
VYPIVCDLETSTMSGLGSSGGGASQKEIEMCMGNILINKFTQGRRDARVRKALVFRLTTAVHL